MASLLSKVAACERRLTRRLVHALGLPRGVGSSASVCLGRQLVLADGGSEEDGDGQGKVAPLVPAVVAGDREDGQGQVALWRRAILMGRRCEPLDFPGAIHYDSFGRRVHSPLCGSRKVAAGALVCRSSDAVDEAVRAATEA